MSRACGTVGKVVEHASTSPSASPPPVPAPAADPDRTLDGRPGAAGGPVARPPRRLRHYVRALRPRQWIKNLLVFMAPAAAGVLTHLSPFLHALGVFGIFCTVASGTYLVNDALDAEADRRHPKKRHRPVASGAISEPTAITLGLSLAAVGLAGSWLLAGWQLFLVMAAYVAIPALGYSLWLKREPVIEMGVVASGFVIRAIAGGVGTHVPLSNWFLVVTSLGALFVVAGKRAAEFQHLGEDRGAHRAVLSQYSRTFLQATLVLSASVTVTAYCLWAFDRSGLSSHRGEHLVLIELTVAPVVLGVLHVLWLLLEGKGGAPEELAIHDRQLQILGLLWVACLAIGIYA